MTPLARLKSEFFDHTKAIRYKPGLEGQRVEDGVIWIGGRSGPRRHDTSSLCHEMAHFVEIDDERMNLPMWGLRVPEIWVFDRMCVEPQTHQITDREIRVAAYQKNFQDYLGIRESVENITESFKYLPDAMLIPLEDGRPAYNNDGTRNIEKYEDVDPSRHRWIVNQVNSLRSVYTLERFLHEWHRKIRLLGT